MMALGTCLAQDQKTERIKYIRKCYAEAKKKIDANGKNGKSPKDMRVIINRLEDEDIPLYDTEQLDFFFDEKFVDGLATKQPPYFIVENWGNHGHIRYCEMLFDPKDHQVIFCYMRVETDAGFVVESRYYYDAKGQCIEQKHNTDNSWTTPETEKENAEFYMKLFSKLTYNGYFTPLDLDKPKKPTTPKTERLKHIRALYAQAKEKSAANDKEDMSNDLHITIHDLGDDQPPRTTEQRIYFDKDGNISSNRKPKTWYSPTHEALRRDRYMNGAITSTRTVTASRPRPIIPTRRMAVSTTSVPPKTFRPSSRC